MQSELRPGLQGLVDSLRGKWKNFWEKRAAINELAKCDPSELARIAEDLGISSSELRFLAASGPDSADLLKRRLQTLGVNATRIDPAVMRDLQLLCTRCNSKQRCAQDLDDKPVPASWPKYCPNEPTIEAMKTKSLN
jgi:uncharacterized protein DUF6455